jgi:predicted RNA-binding Zn ribbon-like protein
VTFSFVSGNLALDFVGTLNERRTTRVENLRHGSDLAGWLVGAGVLDAPPAADAAALAAGLELREALFVLIEHLIDQPGDPLPRPALATVNDRAASAPPVASLQPDGHLVRVGTWRAGLSAVARDGLALFDVRDAELKWCADPACTHPFLDRSRGHRRRWCEMSGCGDRAKAAAYRARRRERAD